VHIDQLVRGARRLEEEALLNLAVEQARRHHEFLLLPVELDNAELAAIEAVEVDVVLPMEVEEGVLARDVRLTVIEDVGAAAVTLELRLRALVD